MLFLYFHQYVHRHYRHQDSRHKTAKERWANTICGFNADLKMTVFLDKLYGGEPGGLRLSLTATLMGRVAVRVYITEVISNFLSL